MGYKWNSDKRTRIRRQSSWHKLLRFNCDKTVIVPLVTGTDRTRKETVQTIKKKRCIASNGVGSVW